MPKRDYMDEGRAHLTDRQINDTAEVYGHGGKGYVKLFAPYEGVTPESRLAHMSDTHTHVAADREPSAAQSSESMYDRMARLKAEAIKRAMAMFPSEQVKIAPGTPGPKIAPGTPPAETDKEKDQ